VAYIYSKIGKCLKIRIRKSLLYKGLRIHKTLRNIEFIGKKGRVKIIQYVLALNDKYLNMYFQNDINNPIEFTVVYSLAEAMIINSSRKRMEEEFINYWKNKKRIPSFSLGFS